MDAIELAKLVESSKLARKWVHDANNALFVAKGFADEIGYIIKGDEHLKPDFSKEELVEMLEKVCGSIDKVGAHLKTLSKYVREDVFEVLGVQNPDLGKE